MGKGTPVWMESGETFQRRGLEWSIENQEQWAQQSRAGRVFWAEGTAWIKALHVCNYCFSDDQPQGVPGQDLHFLGMIIYAFSVHMAFLSGVRTVITLSPLPNAWGQTEARVLREMWSPSPRGIYMLAIKV